MIWFWVFLRLNLFMLRPILFIREQIIQCHCRNFFVYSQSNMKWRIYERNPDKHQSKYYDTKKETFSLTKFSEMGTFFLRPTISIPILRPFLFNCWLLITMDNAPLHLCSSHHRNQWFSEARLDACYRQRRAEPLLYHTRLKSCNSQHATTHRHQGCINVPGWEFFFSKLFYAFVVICSSQ